MKGWLAGWAGGLVLVVIHVAALSDPAAVPSGDVVVPGVTDQGIQAVDGLPDGSVSDPVPDVGWPVAGATAARTVEPDDPLVAACRPVLGLSLEDAAFAAGWVSPVGASLIFDADSGHLGPHLVSCDGVWDGAGWDLSLGFAPSPDPGRVAATGGGVNCCPEGAHGVVAFVSVAAPSGASWVLHRGEPGPVVAWRVAPTGLVRIAVLEPRGFRGVTTAVWFADADGALIGSAGVVGSPFAPVVAD